MKKTLASIILLLVAASAGMAQAKTIPPGSKIYVDAEKGFDAYLTAALGKKKVPVSVVTDKEKADYVLEGLATHEEKGWASKIFLGHRDTSEATIKLIDIKSGDVVYAYAVHKKNSVHANQSTAEACAKHMKEAIAK
jgi:TolB-like protein